MWTVSASCVGRQVILKNGKFPANISKVSAERKFFLNLCCLQLSPRVSLSVFICAFSLCFCASLSSIIFLDLFSYLFHLSVSSLVCPVFLPSRPDPSLSLPPFPLPVLFPRLHTGFFSVSNDLWTWRSLRNVEWSLCCSRS